MLFWKRWLVNIDICVVRNTKFHSKQDMFSKTSVEFGLQNSTNLLERSAFYPSNSVVCRDNSKKASPNKKFDTILLQYIDENPITMYT